MTRKGDTVLVAALKRYGKKIEKYIQNSLNKTMKVKVLVEDARDSQGKASGAEVQKKELNQWFLRITSFAEDLNKDLVKLKDWPERVRVMQKNWIGKSIGAEITFDIKNHNQKITAFTTRIDTIYGVSYLVLASNKQSQNQDSPCRQSINKFFTKNDPTIIRIRLCIYPVCHNSLIPASTIGYPVNPVFQASKES